MTSSTPAVRTTADHEGEVVVFLIGMRVNRWRSVRAWLPVVRAMPRMLAELGREKERGLLGSWSTIGRHGPVVVQYWRDTASLLAYAHDDAGEHRPAWREFYQRARRFPGTVGIWHETYHVPAGHHECVYGDLPPLGLAAAVGAVPVQRRGLRARDRMAAGGTRLVGCGGQASSG